MLNRGVKVLSQGQLDDKTIVTRDARRQGRFQTDAIAFGETRSTRSVIFLRTETRRGAGVLGESERRQSHLHLLSQTVILSYCQTVKL